MRSSPRSRHQPRRQRDHLAEVLACVQDPGWRDWLERLLERGQRQQRRLGDSAATEGDPDVSGRP